MPTNGGLRTPGFSGFVLHAHQDLSYTLVRPGTSRSGRRARIHALSHRILNVISVSFRDPDGLHPGRTACPPANGNIASILASVRLPQHCACGAAYSAELLAGNG